MTGTKEQIVAGHHMRIDTVSSKPKHVPIVVANPTTATAVGRPAGFWGAELRYPYYELTEQGVQVTNASPEHGSGDLLCQFRLTNQRCQSKLTGMDIEKLSM